MNMSTGQKVIGRECGCECICPLLRGIGLVLGIQAQQQRWYQGDEAVQTQFLTVPLVAHTRTYQQLQQWKVNN